MSKGYNWKRNRIAILIIVSTLISFSFLIARVDLYRNISDNWKLMYDVYKKIMTNYSDQIDPQKLAVAGIEGMLAELDPYTVYLERDDRQNLDMLTKGQYGGVGIQLGTRDDSLTVIAPMDDTPAQRSGILPGDRIVEIDGESTKDMNLEMAAKKIRGKRGTTVILSIVRYGEKDPHDFELTRAIIKIQDVPYFGMVTENIGYIRLTRFSRNSYTEIRRAFTSLIEQEANEIIIDLRGNPGGLLDASIRILDMVIDKGEVLLSTKGRVSESNREYLSQSDPIVDSSISLAILIDGGSASASEIVAGAIQDLDRGVVIGTKSFGKGLVQTVYPLDRDRSLKMTTAKYYIPSGRLIQRPGYIKEHIILNEVDEDSLFSTHSGRKVMANGGISPDIELTLEKIPPLTRECWRRGLFFKFASIYIQNNDVNLPIKIDSTVLSDFREFLSNKDISLNLPGEKQFSLLAESLDSVSVENLLVRHSLDQLEFYFEEKKTNQFDVEQEWLIIGLEREISNMLGGISARIESSFDDDKFILKAIEILRDQVTYLNTLNLSDL